MTTVNERIRAARERRGWSQAQLAERTGIARSTLGRIEKGDTPNPGTETVQQIARALGLPVNHFVSDAPEPTVQERVETVLREDPTLEFAFLVGDNGQLEDSQLYLLRAVELLKEREAEQERLRSDGRRRRAP